jgi:hypothetical protein
MVPRALLDVVRNLLVLAATGYGTVLVWRWNWIAAIVACIPIYIVMLNLFGFLTLPLYALTPEVRRAREMERGLSAKKPN